MEQASQQLTLAHCPTPRLDAELLLAHVLGQERTWLYIYPEAELTAEQLAQFEGLIARRAQREPVAYLTGHKAFFGLDFLVTPAVLIPRPETELLVEIALDWASSPISQSPSLPISQSPISIADIGTGSGCIAVTLAQQLPQATLVAADLSAEALAIARQNAHRHRVQEAITFGQSDLLQPWVGPFDLIVSNPPYVSDREYAATAPEVQQYEPRLALTAVDEGLALLERILRQATTRLTPAGMLLMEIGSTQGERGVALAQRYFPQAKVSLQQDLAGLDRLLIVELGSIMSPTPAVNGPAD